ncbi:AAA family ATPase, partial [Arthrospira platensis SPKY1]|nr:AAA family ATPase [Arthrospira platensis SPKY1]
ANIIYINKEQHEFNQIKNADDLFDFVLVQLKPKQINYVFIDEIQEIESFEMALRQLLVKKVDIYCTGSNANMLSGDLATHLSGRYIEFHIHSLSYTEFMQIHKLPNHNNTLNKYICYGGLPYLVHLPLSDEIVYGYLKSIYNTIIL